MPHKPGIGAIFGITAEDGVAAQKRVVLMDRSNLTVVRRTVGDVDGAYFFNGLNADTDDYLVFGVDDDGSPSKEALIRDKITPIPAYQGATFLGNWDVLAARKRPLAGWGGLTSLAGETILPYPAWRTVQNAVVGPDGPNMPQSSLCPGAPQKSHLRLGGGSRNYFPRPAMWVNNNTGIRSNPGFVSGEIVGELKENWEAALWLCRRTDTVNISASYTTYVAGIVYNHASKVVSVRLSINGGSGSGGGMTANRGTYFSFDVAGLDEEVAHHFVFVAQWGDQVKLYVDGAHVQTVSLAGASAVVRNYQDVNYGYLKGILICGTVNTSFPNTCQTSDARVGPVMFYDEILTDADVFEHYEALMVGSTPLVTGYAREICVNAPILYYRLDDPDETQGLQSFMINGAPERLTMVGAGSATFNVTTPVAGGSGIRFQSGVGSRSNGIGGMIGAQREFSAALLMKPELATPGADETILRLCNNLETLYFSISRNELGQITARWSASAAIEAITFTTTIPVDQYSFIVVTLDKSTQECKLYIDGDLVETQATTSTLMDLGATSTDDAESAEVMVGSFVNDSNGATNSFTGVLSEVALFNRTLSASFIKAQYDAAGVL